MSGLAQQGQTLTADRGSWSGTAPISYTLPVAALQSRLRQHRWRHRNSYLVAAADVGATLRVAVTGSNSAGSSQASSAKPRL